MRARTVFALMMAAMVLIGAACSGGSDNAAVDEVTVESLLESSSEAMAGVESAAFVIEQTGAEIFIDDGKLVRFTGAAGRFAAPRSADAIVGVNALGIPTEVGAVAIDGELWITTPLTGEWGPAPDDFTFDPTVLFDDAVGWQSLLAEGLENPILVADEVDGSGRYHLRGTVSEDRVSVLTGGLVEERSEIEIWIQSDTSQISEVAFDAGEGEDLTSWRLELTDYGTDVVVTKPELGTTG